MNIQNAPNVAISLTSLNELPYIEAIEKTSIGFVLCKLSTELSLLMLNTFERQHVAGASHSGEQDDKLPHESTG